MGLNKRKSKLKLCKGFDENPCKICKRKNEKAELLVKSLSRDPETNRNYCIHFISKFRKV